MTHARFPALRPRRSRAHAWSRALVAETVLSPADLIWPLFVTEGAATREPIASMPGVERLSVDLLGAAAKEAASLGIPCLALFPNTAAADRSDDGAEALNAQNLMCRAVRAIKDSGAAIGVLTDIALDPYTSHGHDGLLDAQHRIVNDASGRSARPAGAQPGACRGRHHRAVGHDGRARRCYP